MESSSEENNHILANEYEKIRGILNFILKKKTKKDNPSLICHPRRLFQFQGLDF